MFCWNRFFVHCLRKLRGGETQGPVAISNPGSSTLDLHLLGLEETVIESAAQGRDSSFTLNLIASSAQLDAKGRQKVTTTVIFTKRVGIDSLAGNSLVGLRKAGGPTEEETETIVVALPKGTTEVNASVMGDQSGSIASEKIAIDSSV